MTARSTSTRGEKCIFILRSLALRSFVCGVVGWVLGGAEVDPFGRMFEGNGLPPPVGGRAAKHGCEGVGMQSNYDFTATFSSPCLIPPVPPFPSPCRILPVQRRAATLCAPAAAQTRGRRRRVRAREDAESGGNVRGGGGLAWATESSGPARASRRLKGGGYGRVWEGSGPVGPSAEKKLIHMAGWVRAAE